VPNSGFVQWLGLGFSFGKTSMIRNFVLYLFWSVFNHKPLKQSRKTLATSSQKNVKIMRKIIFLLSILTFMISCENEPVDYIPVDNYSIALDTLKNYSDYIMVDLKGELLVSTNISIKGYSATTLTLPVDSIYIQSYIGYKLKQNNIEKNFFVNFRLLESKNKLNTENVIRYKYFSDYVNFFDRDQFAYYNLNQPIENIHNVIINYQDFYEGNNDINRYRTDKYNDLINPENFNFTIDSINVIENTMQKIEVYYSFKCIGKNEFNDNLVMKNGKGKSTFEYN
jgi:hypothetical protein